MLKLAGPRFALHRVLQKRAQLAQRDPLGHLTANSAPTALNLNLSTRALSGKPQTGELGRVVGSRMSGRKVGGNIHKSAATMDTLKNYGTKAMDTAKNYGTKAMDTLRSDPTYSGAAIGAAGGMLLGLLRKPRKGGSRILNALLGGLGGGALGAGAGYGYGKYQQHQQQQKQQRAADISAIDKARKDSDAQFQQEIAGRSADAAMRQDPSLTPAPERLKLEDPKAEYTDIISLPTDESPTARSADADSSGSPMGAFISRSQAQENQRQRELAPLDKARKDSDAQFQQELVDRSADAAMRQDPSLTPAPERLKLEDPRADYVDIDIAPSDESSTARSADVDSSGSLMGAFISRPEEGIDNVDLASLGGAAASATASEKARRAAERQRQETARAKAARQEKLDRQRLLAQIAAAREEEARAVRAEENRRTQNWEGISADTSTIEQLVQAAKGSPAAQNVVRPELEKLVGNGDLAQAYLAGGRLPPRVKHQLSKLPKAELITMQARGLAARKALEEIGSNK